MGFLSHIFKGINDNPNYVLLLIIFLIGVSFPFFGLAFTFIPLCEEYERLKIPKFLSTFFSIALVVIHVTILLTIGGLHVALK